MDVLLAAERLMVYSVGMPSAIMCLIALIFRAFGSGMQWFSGILMTP